MMKATALVIVFLFCFLASNPQDSSRLKIIEQPIIYDTERIKLSLEYLKERHGINKSKPTIEPVIIVLHYTGSGTLKSNFNYFNNVKIDKGRAYNMKQSSLNVSAHYLVDRDGTIYHLIQDTLFARHIIGLNYCSIGIENIGSKTEPLTTEQISANALLIRQLCKKYKIKYVIGHSEYMKFKKTNLWKETNKNYITYKEDPGQAFLIEVRKRIKDLNVKNEP